MLENYGRYTFFYLFATFYTPKQRIASRMNVERSKLNRMGNCSQFKLFFSKHRNKFAAN